MEGGGSRQMEQPLQRCLGECQPRRERQRHHRGSHKTLSTQPVVFQVEKGLEASGGYRRTKVAYCQFRCPPRLSHLLLIGKFKKLVFYFPQVPEHCFSNASPTELPGGQLTQRLLSSTHRNSDSVELLESGLGLILMGWTF